MTEELKPCPFCGEFPYAREFKVTVFRPYSKLITAMQIECSFGACSYQPSQPSWLYPMEKEEAITAWNTRHGENNEK